jgi:predicted transcriptional regulator
MTTEVITLDADDTIEIATHRIAGLPYSLYPVVERDGTLLGLISDARIRRHAASGHGDLTLRSQALRRETLHADQPLVDAVLRMHSLGARQMAVVPTRDSHQLCGMLAMSDVMRAHVAAANRAGAQRSLRDSWEPRSAVAWPARDTASHQAAESSDPARPHAKV